MPTFDLRFAELQAKITAVLQMLIEEFPDAALRAKQVIDTAVSDAEIQAEYQADEARANAVAAGDAGTASTGHLGYLDDIRISKVARYTSGFTPPTSPHPDPPAIKLPTAVANTNRYTVKCVGPQTVLLSNGNGQLIDGAATSAVEQTESLEVVSDGTSWRSI